jgi:hypothetical protein
MTFAWNLETPGQGLKENPENAAVKTGAVEIRTAYVVWVVSGESCVICPRTRVRARTEAEAVDHGGFADVTSVGDLEH